VKRFVEVLLGDAEESGAREASARIARLVRSDRPLSYYSDLARDLTNLAVADLAPVVAKDLAVQHDSNIAASTTTPTNPGPRFTARLPSLRPRAPLRGPRRETRALLFFGAGQV
jgi:hypothetical protein